MKIVNTAEIGRLNGSSPQPAGTHAPGRQTGTTAPSGESVQISSTALGLASASEIGADLEVFDAERVAELKEAISEGRFRINADAVADKLLASVRAMLQLSERA